MKQLTLLAMGLFLGSVATSMAAEDHNSSRSNRGQMQGTVSPSNDHNTTRSNQSAAQSDADSDSDSDSDSKATRDATSGMATGKRQHKPN